MEAWQTILITIIVVVVYIGIGLGFSAYFYDNKGKLGQTTIVAILWPVIAVAIFAYDVFKKFFSYK